MKRKVQLIIGGIIIVLIAILSAYYLGFFGKSQVRLKVYSQAEDDKVDQCLANINSAENFQDKKKSREELLGLSFPEKQNILHYGFNGGNPEIFKRLLEDPTKTSLLFEEEDLRKHDPLYYYRKYCEFLDIEQEAEETLTEYPLSAIEHLENYFYGKAAARHWDDQDKTALILAIEGGDLEQVKEFLFRPGGNKDKEQWKNPLKALSMLHSSVQNRKEIENWLNTLQSHRKEDDEFWKKIRKFVACAPTVEGMVNYLHKLVVTSREKKSLLYYIMKVGGFRGYLMYKHIQGNHQRKKRSDFSSLLLAANDPHKPIKLTRNSKDKYQQRLRREIERLKGYINIDPNTFGEITPNYQRSLEIPHFRYDRTAFHACVLQESPERLVLCCTNMQEKSQHGIYKGYWKAKGYKDYFGLTPADYLPLVKDTVKKQHLKFLEAGLLAPTPNEQYYLTYYKRKAKELKLANLEDYFTKNFLELITSPVIIKRSDQERNICHIAVLLGDLDVLKFLSQNHPYFKNLCKKEDRHGYTPLDYAQKWLNKEEKKEMCSYLTTQFKREDEITEETVKEAIEKCNWKQIDTWQTKYPTSFGYVWANHGKDLLDFATKLDKPITNFDCQQHLSLLKRLSKCEAPTRLMVHKNKALVDGIEASIDVQSTAINKKISNTANAKKHPEAANLGEVTDKTLYSIPDHTKQNKTIIHKLLPSEAVCLAAEEFNDLLATLEANNNFKIALCMVDDNGNTPLDLVKKALKDKNNNAKKVTTKLGFITKYEQEHLAEYKYDYIYRTKETAASLYKKDNYKGLVVYLEHPASYMSRSLLKTMIQDGAYDVIEEVCGTKNPYVISACHALTATPEGDSPSPSQLETLLAQEDVTQAIKCRYLLKGVKAGTFIDKVVTSEVVTSRNSKDILKQMWKTHSVYWATIVNKKYKTVSNLTASSDDDPARKLKNMLYLQYFFVGNETLKKKYGFNNAHLAVIFNQIEVLKIYAQNSVSQLQTWFNQKDRMGRTPLDYINYGEKKTDEHKQAIVTFIKELTTLDAIQILKSPNAVSRLEFIKKCRPNEVELVQWLEKVKKALLSDQKDMLQELAKKDNSDRLLHYTCPGAHSDIEFVLQLLETTHFTREEIEQKDINSCEAIDYVPESSQKQFQQVFDIYKALADIKAEVDKQQGDNNNSETITIASTKLQGLVANAEAYKPNPKEQLRYPASYALAKKWWRKKWVADWLGAFLDFDPYSMWNLEQENYLPRLYSVLLKEEYKHIAKALIEEKKKGNLDITLDEQDSEGKTWLIKAIEKKQWDIAALLVDAGVDLNITDIYDTSVRYLTIVRPKYNRDNLKAQVLETLKEQIKEDGDSQTLENLRDQILKNFEEQTSEALSNNLNSVDKITTLETLKQNILTTLNNNFPSSVESSLKTSIKQVPADLNTSILNTLTKHFKENFEEQLLATLKKHPSENVSQQTLKTLAQKILKKQLLTYIEKQKTIKGLEKTIAWLGKRCKQIFYLDDAVAAQWKKLNKDILKETMAFWEKVTAPFEGVGTFLGNLSSSELDYNLISF